MVAAISKRLDHVDALRPGGGHLDVYGAITGNRDKGAAGVGVTYEHRAGSSISLFADGGVRRSWDDYGSDTEGYAVGGLRWTW